jgi:hypothetical protein
MNNEIAEAISFESDVESDMVSEWEDSAGPAALKVLADTFDLDPADIEEAMCQQLNDGDEVEPKQIQLKSEDSVTPDDADPP